MPKNIDYDECYSILELAPSAPLRQIEEQVKLLRLAWHPDKFNDRLKGHAEERLKSINAAFDELRRYWRAYGKAPRTNTSRSRDHLGAEYQRAEAERNAAQQRAEAEAAARQKAEQERRAAEGRAAAAQRRAREAQEETVRLRRSIAEAYQRAEVEAAARQRAETERRAVEGRAAAAERSAPKIATIVHSIL
jgi:DnaJ-class molecular chaperone